LHECLLPTTPEKSGELACEEAMEIIVVSAAFAFGDIPPPEELNCFVGVGWECDVPEDSRDETDRAGNHGGDGWKRSDVSQTDFSKSGPILASPCSDDAGSSQPVTKRSLKPPIGESIGGLGENVGPGAGLRADLKFVEM